MEATDASDSVRDRATAPEVRRVNYAFRFHSLSRLRIWPENEKMQKL